MSEQPSVRNELNGNVGGPVVQSGAIHGNVVIHPPAQAQTALERLVARLEAQQQAEDAAAAAASMAQGKRLSTVRRRKRIFFWLVLACEAVGLGWAKLGHLTIEGLFVWAVASLLSLLGYAGAKYEIRFGRRVPWASLMNM